MENLLVIDGISLSTIAALLPISILTLFLPGFLLTLLLFGKHGLGWLARLAASLGLSISLGIIVATIVLAAGAALGWLLVAMAGLNLVLSGVLLLKRRGQSPARSEQAESEAVHPLLLGAFILGSAFIVWRFWVPINRFEVSLDFWSYLAFVRKWATFGPRPAVDVRLGTSAGSFRYVFGGWMLIQSLLSVASGVDPIDISAWWVPPILMTAFYLSQYGLAKTLFQSRNAAILASLVTILSLGVQVGGRDSRSQVVFNRINEDKFLLTFVLLPVALMFMFRYLKRKDKGDMASFLIISLALPLTHPLGLVEAGLAFGLFALLHFGLERRRQTFQDLAAILLPLILLLLIPLAERQVATKPYSVEGEEGLARYERFHRSHLLIVDQEHNRYITHPNTLRSPITLVALGLSPLLLFFVKRDMAARFLLANMAGLTLLLYTPFLAPILGRIITPWMLWRLVYLLPSAMTLGYLLHRGIIHAAQAWPRGPGKWKAWDTAPLLILVLGAIALERTGAMDWPSPPNEVAYEAEVDILLAARDFVQEPSVIMSRAPLQQLVPAFIEKGFVPTWLRNNPIEEDVLAFYNSWALDAKTWQALLEYNCRYLVVGMEEGAHFFLPSELLRPLYANDRYALFEVAPVALTHSLLQARTAMEEGRLGKALVNFRQAGAGSPLSSLLGQAEILAQQGQDEEAERVLRQARTEFVDSPWPWIDTANLHKSRGEFEEALASYLRARDLAGETVLVPNSTRNGLEAIAQKGIAGFLALPSAEHERWGVTLNRTYGDIVDYDISPLRIGWYADWRVREEQRDLAGLEHAQTVVLSLEHYPPDWSRLARAIANQPGAIWLVGLWPEWEAYGNQTPTQYAESYHQVYRFIRQRDPAAVVAAGGLVQATPLRLRWLDLVLEAYQAQYGGPLPADAWHINLFVLREEPSSWGAGIPVGVTASEGILYDVNDNADPLIFEEQVRAFRQWMADRGQREKALLLSGYGIQMPSEYLDRGDAQVIEFMKATFEFLSKATDPEIGCPGDDGKLVQRWLWHSLNEKALDPATGAISNGMLFAEDQDGRLVLTIFGRAFASFMTSVP